MGRWRQDRHDEKSIPPRTPTAARSYIGSFLRIRARRESAPDLPVTVDEPRKGAGYYGGTVACPAVREMLRKGLTLLNVPPRNADEQEKAIRAQGARVEH
jgi:hypothetical protein